MHRGMERYSGISRKEVKKIIPFYVERHRILPGCMGGKYVEGNVAWLTPEEHYVAHQLLVKMYPTNVKVLHAAMMMIVPGKTSRNNKLYGWLRRRFVESMRGRPIPESAKKNMRKPHKKMSEEGRLNISIAGRGRKFTSEHKIKIGEANRKRVWTNYSRKKASNSRKGILPWNTGKHWDEETRKKISNSRKGQHHTEETKEKLRTARRKRTGSGMSGKHHSQEWKINHSDKMKGENNPFYGKQHSEYSKTKMSLSHKKGV